VKLSRLESSWSRQFFAIARQGWSLCQRLPKPLLASPTRPCRRSNQWIESLLAEVWSESYFWVRSLMASPDSVARLTNSRARLLTATCALFACSSLMPMRAR